MFAGLCAFALTPMDERGIDEAAFVGLVARLAQAGVDSIGTLGSTGKYAYLRREERTDEVFDLYAEVDRHVSVPLCVYDNPDITGFAFSDELYRDVARLTNVQAIKVPAPPIAEATTRIAQLRELTGTDAVVGVSGDSLAAASLLAGAPTWFSVIGGLLPEAALTITRAARTGDTARAIEASDRLSGLWELFETYGSLRAARADPHDPRIA